MKIAEIYNSLQGEGFLTGVESTLVRASGCNLRCWFCDTPYTSWQPEGEDLPVHEILARVDQLGRSHVIVTGGEPMLYSELVPLCAGLRARGLHITIETAGTLDLPLQCDLMSISPKLAGSAPSRSRSAHWSQRHERVRHAPEVVRRLVRDYPYQIKFVVDTRADCQAVEDYLRELPEIDRSRVMLMPQGTDQQALVQIAEWLEPYCSEHQLHFCPRKHIEWFGLVRGT